jgi:anti-anti-sigma factor
MFRGATVTVSHAPADVGVIVAVAGEIDLSTVVPVRAELVQALNSAHADARAGTGGRDHVGPARTPLLVVDLTAVTFLASIGLSLLTDVAELCHPQPAAGRGPAVLLRIVTGHSPTVQRPLHLTGLDQVLPLFLTLEAALQDRDGRAAAGP